MTIEFSGDDRLEDNRSDITPSYDRPAEEDLGVHSATQRNLSNTALLMVLREVFTEAWDRETTIAPHEWSEENPSWGQSLATAMVAQDILGGDIVYSIVDLPDGTVRSHYANRLGESSEAQVDFAFEEYQIKEFGDGLEFSESRVSRVREEAYTNEAVMVAYFTLRDKVFERLEGVLTSENI